MKIGKTRSLSHYFHLLIGMIVLAPQGFISLAFAQDAAAGGKSFGAQMVDSLGIFLYAFILMVLGGISLIIYNGIAIRKKAFVKDEVVEPILAEVGRLNIDGARELCDQFKMPATNVLKAGLDRIQDDELDTDSIEKGLEEASSVEMAKPFTWINMLNTIGSIAPMVGLLGTVVGMIGAFDVLTAQGFGGDSSKKMAGEISGALWTTAAGLVTAIPTLIAYFIYKTKFGNIAAEVNRLSGEMVFTLVRAARNPEAFAEDEEDYGQADAGLAPAPDIGIPAPAPAPEGLPPPGIPPAG
ncbi:MAG: MotA/TolQ/ExbB proton channel family protein [Opitutales bacterium]|jgi:biopolymer transport protein ExbB